MCKKICLTLIMCLFAINNACYAMETSEITETIIEETDNSKIIENTVDTTTNNEYENFSINEYRERMKAQPGDFLTEQQKAEGWVLLDGWIYPPATIASEGTGIAEVQNSDICGYVTFSAIVPSDFHEECFIEITNINNYDTYEFKLSELNHFTTNQKIPVGSYIISNGGPITDFASRYAITELAFKVNEAESQTIKVEIYSKEEKKKQEIVETPNTPDASSDTIVDNVKEYIAGDNQNNLQGHISKSFYVELIFLLLIIIAFIYWKFFSKNDED